LRTINREETTPALAGGARESAKVLFAREGFLRVPKESFASFAGFAVQSFDSRQRFNIFSQKHYPAFRNCDLKAQDAGKNHPGGAECGIIISAGAPPGAHLYP
jgi:hypothetical protein